MLKILKKLLNRSLMTAVIAIPIQDKDSWTALSYSKIQKHELEFSDKGLKISVNSSAMPLIYPIPNAVKVKSVSISGRFEGLIKFPSGSTQGEKGFDDYRLRVGLVLPGKETLNFFERAVAADWVKKLFSLAPKNQGIDHILFLNMSESKKNIGKERAHPASDLIKEKVVWSKSDDGFFEFKYDFTSPKDVVAIWLAVDADDIKANYKIFIKDLSLDIVGK